MLAIIPIVLLGATALLPAAVDAQRQVSKNDSYYQ